MPDESRYMFNKINKTLLTVWQPDNIGETILVEQLAFNHLRLKRALKLETEILQIADEKAKSAEERDKRMGYKGKYFLMEHLDFEKFEKFSRYLTSIQRQILRILHEIERVQAIRKGQNAAAPQVIDVDIQSDRD